MCFITIPIGVIVVLALFGFVAGKMLVESVVSFLGVVLCVIISVFIITRLKRVIDDMNSSDDDWQWDEN